MYRLFLARLLLHKNQYDLAISDFTKAIQLSPKPDDGFYNSRGLSYSAKRDYALAIADFSKAIEIYPNPLCYNNRGLAYFGNKNYEMSLKDFNEAIRLAPRDGRLYSSRADLYITLGQIPLAISDLLKTIEFSYNDSALIQSAKDRLKNLGVTE